MWQDIINEFQEHPRDVITVPMHGSGIWFYVYVRQGRLYIGKAKNHNLSSKLSNDRELHEKEYEKVLDIYHRREAGENVSQIAIKTTYSQVYWYGIFSEMKL